jgi:transketolase
MIHTYHSQALKQKLDARSLALRKIILDGFTSARRGHLGSYFSLVEIIRVLYDDTLRVNAKNPHWKERDRFILSKGHGSMALYAVLSDHGFFPKKHIKDFVNFNSILGQHPDSRKVPGVEASTGSLGHGLSIGVGMALAAKIDHKKYRVFVVISDAESQEGSIWEAALAIHKHNLTNLITLVDYNHMQSYGSSHEVLDLEPLAKKWEAFGFGVSQINGHDVVELRRTIKHVIQKPTKPQIIICHTVKGKGIRSIENDMDWHHKTKLSDEDIANLYTELARYI